MKRLTVILATTVLLSACHTQKSLVPGKPSAALDYFSTWNIQGYVANYAADPTIEVMDEKHMFGKSSLEGWCNFFPDFREDLIFVMDDSWDIPAGTHNGNYEHMTNARLDESRFPSFQGNATERLTKLVKRVKSMGWKGLGGWICAQEATAEADASNPQEYWKTRLIENQKAGMAYWKVDYGKQEKNAEWRNMITQTAHKYAPSLQVEHAFVNKEIERSDAFRTYDVEVVTSVPVTLQRIARLLPYKAQEGAGGIINCEDEPYMAAGLGCAIGVMRHPLNGPLPDGRLDHVFPVGGRDLKSRLDEVNRALKWHRIALPFGVSDDAQIDSLQLQDIWVLGERETWVPSHHPGDTLREAAPARISRRMPLPKVECTSEAPFVAASTYPNGAVAVATLERGIIHRSYTPKAIVTIEVAKLDAPVGIFGAYEALHIKYATAIPKKARIMAQDLKGKVPVDITNRVEIKNNLLTIPGDVIRQIGLMAATPGDKSEPALVMQIQ